MRVELATPTSIQPREVCMTLFFLEGGEKDYRVNLRKLFEPQVGGWKEEHDLRVEKEGEIVQKGFVGRMPPKLFAGIYFLEIVPHLSRDAYAVQIIINLIDTAWSAAATWLQDELHILFNSPPDSLLGYTVVYRADAATKGEPEAIEISSSILGQLKWIHKKAPIGAPSSVVQQHFSGMGWLSLVSYPEEARGGLVYIAIGVEESLKSSEADFAHSAYATYYSQLSMVDLFFHKGFLQGKELDREYVMYERDMHSTMQSAIRDLLGHSSHAKKIIEQDLKRMSERIAAQAEYHWLVNRVELSLHRQITGIKRLFSFTEMSTIAQRHLVVLEAYLEDVRSFSLKSSSTLEIARTALSFVKAEETKHTNSIREKLNILVTFFGVFLAVNQVLDDYFAQNMIKEYFTSLKHTSYWAKFTVRIFMATLVTVTIYWLIEVLRQIFRRDKF